MRRANSPRPASDWDRTGLTGRHLSVVPEVDTSPSAEEWPVAYHIAGCGVEPRTHEERLQRYQEDAALTLAGIYRDR